MSTLLNDKLVSFRKQFPALQNKQYLNFGAQGVMSSRTIDAICQSYEFVQETGPLSGKMFEWIISQCDATKVLLAENFGGAAQDYALTQNATEGCNIALWGFDWQPGDSLLLTDSEHNGVVAAAKQLSKRRGVAINYCKIEAPDSHEEILKKVAECLKLRPKMFVFSHVLWNNGKVLPAKEIAKLCKQSDCIAVIDGAQSAGVLPIDVNDIGADAYAITGHKWIGGPEGIGALHIRKEILDLIHPTFVGWRSTKYDGSENPPFLEGASRFEVATSPFPLLKGLMTALNVHQEVGSSLERYNTILSIAAQLRSSIEQLPGLKLVCPIQESSLVSFTLEKGKPSALVQTLEEKYKIIVRTIPSPHCIRASINYFSAQEALDLSAALKDLLTSQAATN